ncbi:hypothetical protein OOZ35_14140 [Mesoflavibacter profundi]|uniref:Uncharacterized protein n=1 Tax=Mesoflavibacter profundi TaxID=2708110 RepID=A0ABT4S3M0_9FLAO|nr:hypothetical protein [Mesoflavibacter profundi]MDA0175888.1 hypothetical protein [Mesoflavibacter profundi]MDA0178639.1 hypothetical protein [Mesoflavibacter profundi]
MQDLYRLKPEAVKFFNENIATIIQTLDDWSNLQVDENALEIVPHPYLTFGHENKARKSCSLSGWSPEQGSHFHFTIIFPSHKYEEYDVFRNGKMTRELMNKIQSCISNFQTKLSPVKED